MNQQGFEDYTYFAYGHTTGTANSYIMAIRILDRIFAIKDVFHLQGKSLTEVDDENLLHQITDFVVSEEKKFKSGEDSIFKYGQNTQKSYPCGWFCSAAMKHLQMYQTFAPQEIEANAIVDKLSQGKDVSAELLDHFDITKEGKDQVSQTKVRVGQAYYRKMIVSLYQGKCCITGLDVPKLLRASHIIRWADDKENRMNPENGLCLSGTYDLAFDQHLISFDEDYRMVIGDEISEHFTNAVTREYFKKFVGKKIAMPSKFLPNQEFLQAHRELLR
ncbi:MAG: HNH endonuclease [Bacteroidales bacterium]|nr:HNH endonuclease [Bacteroidales bacterium]